MVSVESRDERKRLIVGFGLEKEMDDTELEEGEACYYQNGDDSTTIDPDVALSYIDEKIQDVLGHFQKDFEGGVSAENLGAKYGGYGSFLPSYQRSPALAQQRTPAEAYEHNIPGFPNILDLEASRHNPLTSSASTLAMRLGARSSAAAVASENGQVKRDGGISLTHAEKSTLKGEPVHNSENSYDQKTLRLRIKVGSDDLPTKKNAEIYCGLGLDVSPSSSSDNSFSDSEGLSRDIKDAPDESPTSILKIVTSFLVHGERLLSPLSDDFIHFTQKEKYSGESVSKPLHKAKVNGLDSRKGNQKLLSENIPNAYEKSDFRESANGNAGVILKKDIDIDSFVCEELVSNALKLPLLSNTHSSPSDSAKALHLPKSANKGSARDRSPNDTVEEESLVYPKKQGSHKGKKTDNSAKVDSNVSDRGRMLDTETTDPMKAKVIQGEYVTDQSLGEDQFCTAGRTKLKGGQTNGGQNDSSFHKRNKSSRANSLLSKSDSDDTRKDHIKSKNKYQETFGDLEIEPEDNEVASKKMSSMEKLKDSELVQNGKKTAKPCKSEEYPRVSANEKAVFPVSGPKPNAMPSVAAPLVQEDWVQCDKCQSWRLLPLGTNPKSLPEKWICSMLNWLPAMNRCSVSEEETTQALRALYQASAPGLVLAAPPETQLKQHDHPGKILSGASSSGAYDSAQDHQMLSQQGKKKYKSKDVPNRPIGAEPTEFPNSVKNLQVSAKDKSLNCGNQSSSIDEYGYQHFGQSSSSLSEKHGNTPSRKKSSLDSYSAGGDSKDIKIRNKGHGDIDGSRASKKVKTEDALYREENCISDQGGPLLKVRPCLSGNPPSSAPRKDQKRSNSRTKDLKSDIQNDLPVTEITSADNSLPSRKSDSKSSSKKRKGHVNQDASPYTAQESSENGQRKEKKARTSRTEGKDTTTSKASGAIERRTKDQDRGSSLSQRSDAVDSLKRDRGSVHPSVAATSSSSKVSGSCRNKTTSQEVKGSPVESVSSSPLRVSSTQKFASTIGNSGKDDMPDDSFLGTSSLNKFLDDGGSARSGTLKRDVTLKVNHHGFTDSSIVDLQDRDLGLASRGTIKQIDRSSRDFATHQPIVNADSQSKIGASEQYEDEERRKEDRCRNDGAHLKKLENGSASCPKGAEWSLKSGNGVVHTKFSDLNESLDNNALSLDENLKNRKSKFQEKSCVVPEKVDKNSMSERYSAGKDLNEISKGENQSKYGSSNGSDNKTNALTKQDIKQNVVLDTDFENTSKSVFPDKADGVEVSGRGKSHSLPPSARQKNDKATRPQPVPGSHKENGAQTDDIARTPKQSKKGSKQNENPSNSSRHSNTTTHKVRDHDGPPLRKEPSSQSATNAIKEAKDLKHLADRLKNSGSSESTGMYFQAALKFLHGASLLESCNSENSKHNEIQSMQVYSSTARLCGFCAHEYERSNDKAAAALAYKCMEVAYMRVVYSSHASASRDRNELQTALQIVPPGESPSSSASDVDNLNNPAVLDKISTIKGVGSPLVAGNQGITAQNRSSFMRLLNYAQDATHAMEAARKARITFAAANSRPREPQSGDAISSVKRAIDFNFQDVDGLLRLVRIAMDAISR